MPDPIKPKLTEKEIDALVDGMSLAEADTATKYIEELTKKKMEGKFYNYKPQDYQVPIHADQHRIVDVRGGNRSGKSEACAYTVACHVLGIYPDWWQGLKFNEHIFIGVISISTEQLRKSAQVKLMGEPHEIGTGYIPKDKIIEYAFRPGTNGCLDWVLIRHSSGGVSRIQFMVGEQGMAKFMGYTWSLAWFDEIPEEDIFVEVQMRLVDKRGYIILSYYPKDGETELTKKLDDMPDTFCSHYELHMQDNATIDPEEIKMHELTMPEWMKESRLYGRAGAGEGRLFTFSRDDYTCDPFEIESHWPRIGGFDVGYEHGTAAIALALEYVGTEEAPTVYVYREYLRAGNLPGTHAIALRSWGDLDFKIDTSSHRRSITDGRRVFDMYLENGIQVSNANTKSGSVFESINIINQMLAEKRLYVFSSCRELIKQMGTYRLVKSKDGRVRVTERNDDLVDALRYAITALDEARVMGVNRMKPMPRIIQWNPINPRLGL